MWHNTLLTQRDTIPFSIAMKTAMNVQKALDTVTTRVSAAVVKEAIKGTKTFKQYLEHAISQYAELDCATMVKHHALHDNDKLGMLLRCISVEHRCDVLRAAGFADIVIDLLLLPKVYHYEMFHYSSLCKLCPSGEISLQPRHRSIVFRKG